jgi:hypothetical protein
MRFYKPALSIITACSRPQNLGAIAAAIQEQLLDYFQISWIVEFDEKMAGTIIGNRQKNRGLDRVSEGWIWFLDDDNTIHPDFAQQIHLHVTRLPDAGILFFHQDLGDGEIRTVEPSTVRVHEIDLAQFVVRRELVGDRRFELLVYHSDGLIIESVYNENPEKAVFIDDVLCYYNGLSQMSG